MRQRAGKKRIRKEDNRGFSIMEMVVVIAIITILTGITIVSTAALGGRAAQKCSEQLVSSLNAVRVSTMGKNETVTCLYKDTDNCYYLETAQSVGGEITKSTKKVGEKQVKIYYSENASGASQTELDANGITIAFDRASGAMRSVTYNRSTGAWSENGTKVYCRKIYVKQGNKVATITLYPETGKIVLE